MTLLRVLKREAVDSFWLSKAMLFLWANGVFQALCRRHVNQASVSLERLKSVELVVPPPEEQRAIAHVLRTVQQAKEATAKVLAAARQLKQSLMRHLFTYGPVPFDQADKVPLKETEVGEIPEGWSLTPLGETAKIGNGSTPKRTNYEYWTDGTVPWLNSGKVHERIIYHADQFVTKKAQEECHLPLVKRRSVVVAITGQGKTLGNAALLACDTTVSQHLAYIQPTISALVPEYTVAEGEPIWCYVECFG
jgi:type I restriction enzyme S subunit